MRPQYYAAIREVIQIVRANAGALDEIRAIEAELESLVLPHRFSRPVWRLVIGCPSTSTTS